jgi:hypothetical protein
MAFYDAGCLRQSKREEGTSCSSDTYESANEQAFPGVPYNSADDVSGNNVRACRACHHSGLPAITSGEMNTVSCHRAHVLPHQIPVFWGD